MGNMIRVYDMNRSLMMHWTPDQMIDLQMYLGSLRYDHEKTLEALAGLSSYHTTANTVIAIGDMSEAFKLELRLLHLAQKFLIDELGSYIMERTSVLQLIASVTEVYREAETYYHTNHMGEERYYWLRPWFFTIEGWHPSHDGKDL